MHSCVPLFRLVVAAVQPHLTHDPGFNDRCRLPVSHYTASVHTRSARHFLEATYGHSRQLAGCARPKSRNRRIFCNNAAAASECHWPHSRPSRAPSFLQNLPFLFPDATVLDPGYYAVTALNELQPAFWDGSRMAKVPSFAWGGRIANAPPNLGFPGWFNINSTKDFPSA